MYLDRMLLGLNINQKDAVTSDPRGKLQIIAGPGTGKTKVLVSRVVFLLVECKIPPQRIVVTTFTKKAANEMIERLKLILGIQHSDIDISKLIIGTFHSICFRIIMTYGKLIGKEKFRIADERDSNQILKEVIEKCNTLGFKEWDLEPYKKPGNSSLDERKVKRQISKLKSMAVSPEAYFATSGAGKSSTKRPRFNAFIYFMYSSYQASLSYDNLLDFDDCLFTCYELISSHPVLLFVEHVLVDEFQDTNEIQLQLMYEFANSLGNLTIVGDPDQSIYGFRDAQVINFRKMVDHYGEPNIRIISLNENYRSTSDILNFSENIMREQKESRFAKELKSQFKATFPPVYSTFDSQEMEAEWICSEIEEIIKLPGLFSHKDIAILVRSAFQTKALEDVLVRRRIPYFMVRGKAFWERKEVLSILDYMRIVGNDNDRMAYLRTINYPKRGIGETSMEEITTYLNKKADQTVYHSLIEITEGKTDCKLSKSVISKLANYLNIISKYRAIINSEIGSFDLSSLFDNIYEESGLKDEVASNKTPDEATGNVMEVKRQFCEFVPVDETLPEIVGGEKDLEEIESKNIIELFIQSIGLYDHSNDDDKKSTPRVNLSTIHGSKGLEWPVVFVPGLSEGILPAKFAMDNEDEERRCFYVATTRAKALLYISSFTEQGGKWFGGEEVSRFTGKTVAKLPKHQTGCENMGNLRELYKLMGKELDVREEINLDNFKYFSGNSNKEKKRREDFSAFTFGSAKTVVEPEMKRRKGSSSIGGGWNSTRIPLPAKSREVPPLGNSINVKREVNRQFSAPKLQLSSVSGPLVSRAPTYIPQRKVPQHLTKIKKLHGVKKLAD